jgi:signal transduction histidine kinase
MRSFRRIDHASRRAARSPAVVVAAGLVAVLLVGIVDNATGPHLSMNLLYLVPVCAVTALLGLRRGLEIGAVAIGCAAISDIVFDLRSAELWIGVANVMFMALTLVAVVLLVAALRDRAAAARAAEQRSQYFLGYAAHQLRAPLARISGSVDALVLSGDDDVDRDDMLAELGAESVRAGKLVRSLLSAARATSPAELPVRDIDLASLLTHEVSRAATTSATLDWTLELDHDQPALVTANPDALTEAFANLFDNAAAHARSTVHVRLTADGRWLEVDVTDDGPGVPPQQTERVFEPFVTLDGAGSGLGLPIARSIAETHGGSLAYDETRGFVLRIPASRPRDATSRTLVTSQGPAGAG